MLKLWVNGEPCVLEAGTLVRDLVRSRLAGASTEGVAVAKNGEVIRRSEWDQVRLEAGDRVELVTAMQGG